jgi:lipoyl-dependent peroxiredoxin subunit D
MSATKDDLLADLGLAANYSSAPLDILAATDSRYLRDLRMNVKSVLSADSFTPKEAYLLAVAVAANENNTTLLQAFMAKARENEATEGQIAEAIACASLLSTNNVFYRFRHYVDKEEYNSAPARLRMNIMMNPVLGKEFFELISLAVSAVNGCEMCVKSHEQSVLNAGATAQRVWDSIRLASVIVSLGKVVS